MQTGNQLDNQTREDIRGLVMDAIEASVIYPAIVLNVLKARSEFSVDQDTVSDSLTGTKEPLLKLNASRLTSYTTVSFLSLSRLIIV